MELALQALLASFLSSAKFFRCCCWLTFPVQHWSFSISFWLIFLLASGHRFHVHCFLWVFLCPCLVSSVPVFCVCFFCSFLASLAPSCLSLSGIHYDVSRTSFSICFCWVLCFSLMCIRFWCCVQFLPFLLLLPFGFSCIVSFSSAVQCRFLSCVVRLFCTLPLFSIASAV